MKILIPTILSTKHKVGVTEYLIGLINSIQEIDTENEYFIITTKENRKFFNITKDNFKEIVVPIFDFSRILLRVQYLIFTIFALRPIIKYYKIDLLHEPCSWYILKKIKTVVTIHDIVELNNKKYTFILNFIKKKMIFSSIQNSSSIISVSNFTSEQIRKIYNKNDNVFKIYNGISSLQFTYPNKNDVFLEKYKLLSKQYFIFIGTLLRHKNISRLVKAFSIFFESNQNYKLVLAGKFANATLAIRKLIKRTNLEKNVLLTGYFEDVEKVGLIKNAQALLLVSEEEGFGFPILEAQSLGIPVITSNTSSMKEIANNSALLVDPNSVSSIVDGMNSIISNSELEAKLIRLGKENIKRYSWDITAKETIKVYKKTIYC